MTLHVNYTSSCNAAVSMNNGFAPAPPPPPQGCIRLRRRFADVTRPAGRTLQNVPAGFSPMFLADSGGVSPGKPHTSLHTAGPCSEHSWVNINHFMTMMQCCCLLPAGIKPVHLNLDSVCMLTERSHLSRRMM